MSGTQISEQRAFTVVTSGSGCHSADVSWCAAQAWRPDLRRRLAPLTRAELPIRVVQDAVNLGWKLAQVVNKTSPESLLDTYHTERHPVGARVLHNTMAQVALARADDRHQALRDTMTTLVGMDEPRRHIAAMLSALDIHYDLGQGHALLGRRMPDLDVGTEDGPTRVFALLHDGRPLLLNLGEPGGFDISPWANRVRLVDATHVGAWELPVLGEVAAPAAVLIRPDGHVAWAGDLTDSDLPRALATWFGPAAPAHSTFTSD
jgi:3-(3-hydroxy-phenyl)propionate hydroxylase